MAIDNFKLDPNAAGISEATFSAHTHNYRKVTRIGVDETKAWLSPTFEDVIDNGDTVAVGLNDIEGAALTTATAKTGTPPGVWSGLGIVVGLDGINSEDISLLLSLGINKIRLALPTYVVEHYYGDMQTWVVDLLNAGFYVIWGVTAGPDFTGAQWTAYKAEVQYLAAWAETLDNSNFEFQIGNEEETRNNGSGAPDDATVLTDLKALAATCQSIYTVGKISYAVCFIDGVDAWVSAGITPNTDLDLIGLNTYSADARWDDTIDDWATAFSTNGYVAEFNYDNMLGDPITEAQQAVEITTMIDYIKASGLSSGYFFCWEDWEGGLFGVKRLDDSYRPLWNSLLNSG